MGVLERELKRQAMVDFAVRANREVSVRMGTFKPATSEETTWARDGFVDVKHLDSVQENR